MTKVLNRRQARWAQELAFIDFKIYYHPETQNRKPDTLSRRSEYRPGKGGVENQLVTTVLGKNHFEERLTRSFICSSARLASLPERRWTEEFLASVREEGKKDEAYEQARKQEALQITPSPEDRKAREWSYENGLLYIRNLLWVPKGLVQRIMESEHNTKVAGHMGQDKTIELIRRNFWWPLNERTNHRLRQKLPRVPAQQGVPAPTVRDVLPTGITIHPMAIHSNGLHHETSPLRRLRSAVGGHRPIHQDGALPSSQKRRKNGGKPGGHFRKRSTETPRASH